jgi:hypothetical protein
MSALSPVSIGLALTSIFAISGCEDSGKIAQEKSVKEVAKLLSIVKEDVDQMRHGLPEGAAKLGKLLEPDPGANLAALQKAIQTARAQVKELDLSKGTFFSFADPSGVVLRSEADPDTLAGKSVVAAFPALKKALEPTSGVVEAFGEMSEMRGVRTGADAQWVLAHPVKDGDGHLTGMFVTGWSFRRFAYHLEEMAKRHLVDDAQRDEKKRVPLIYVFALKGKKAYGAPVTPDVNADAVEKLDLVAKTAGGPAAGVVDITGRAFGYAAQRTPDLADDAGIAVIMSEL